MTFSDITFSIFMSGAFSCLVASILKTKYYRTRRVLLTVGILVATSAAVLQSRFNVTDNTSNNCKNCGQEVR